MKLIADQVVVERAGRVIVDGASFVVAAGSALVLTGANGAGKTTLLRALAGLLPIAAGRVALEGGDSELTVGEQAHVIAHTNALKARLTVRENLSFWSAYFSGHEDQAAIDRALAHFGLVGLAEFLAGELSAGQKRRVALARLIAAPRPLWLLDEPTVSLDKASTEKLTEAANAHLDGGGLIIAATHLPLGFANATEFQLKSAIPTYTPRDAADLASAP